MPAFLILIWSCEPVTQKKEIVKDSPSYLNTKISFNIIYLENLFNKNE